MPVEVHVAGRIATGRLAEFLEACGPWLAFRQQRGRAPARVLQGLSGPMNSVVLVFAYEDLAAYEREEAEDAADPEYARLASAMPFEGPIVYRLYRIAEPSA